MLRFSFGLSEREAEALRKAAAEEKRSVANFVAIIVVQWMRERGYLK